MMSAAQERASVAAIAVDAAANLAVLRRQTDGALQASLVEIKKLVEDHVEADNAAFTALRTEMAANTVVTLQVKEILDVFKTFGAIVKFVLKWVTLIGGAIAAVVALRK